VRSLRLKLLVALGLLGAGACSAFTGADGGAQADAAADASATSDGGTAADDSQSPQDAGATDAAPGVPFCNSKPSTAILCLDFDQSTDPRTYFSTVDSEAKIASDASLSPPQSAYFGIASQATDFGAVTVMPPPGTQTLTITFSVRFKSLPGGGLDATIAKVLLDATPYYVTWSQMGLGVNGTDVKANNVDLTIWHSVHITTDNQTISFTLDGQTISMGLQTFTSAQLYVGYAGAAGTNTTEGDYVDDVLVTSP
jgi:hypothetical protein